MWVNQNTQENSHNAQENHIAIWLNTTLKEINNKYKCQIATNFLLCIKVQYDQRLNIYFYEIYFVENNFLIILMDFFPFIGMTKCLKYMSYKECSLFQKQHIYEYS